ncbi:hypothetical protein XU18_1358 [Perkinsela sp. CCAP 1560/4]|nr:hypothetical protein XU18_1358 [Perkinsela sp. CCAP 1560/4]|eukprot:KNH08028.1 hypothetical protein XU18_1358 [Perkinsela sp. CCAP 1560/4]
MNNSDVIRAHKALCTEFYEFRDATLSESRLTEPPADVVNLLKGSVRTKPERVTEPVRTQSDLAAADSAVEIVPPSVLHSWFSLDLNGERTRTECAEVDLQRCHLKSERLTHKLSSVYQFVMLFCESMIQLRPVRACVDWTLQKSSHNRRKIASQDILDFFENICTDVFEGTESSNLTIASALAIVLDRWDYMSTKLVYGHAFAGRTKDLDKFSSATTFTNRLCGAWYVSANGLQGSAAEHMKRMRVLHVSPRQKSLSECLRHLFIPDRIEKHKRPWRIGLIPLSFPEILLICVERANENTSPVSDKHSSKHLKCAGFPQRIIFCSQDDNRRELEEHSNDVTTIQISADRQFHEQYNVHSVGFCEESTSEANFCMALRSNSPYEAHDHGVWYTVSRDGKNHKHTRISSLEALQRKAISYVCFVKTTRGEAITSRPRDEDQADDRKDKSEDDTLSIRSWHSAGSNHSDTTSLASSPPNEAYHIELAKDNTPSRPLIAGASSQQASLPQETMLGEPLYDEEWDEALDKGKEKKSKPKPKVFPKGNTFQRFMDSTQRMHEMGNLPPREGKSRKHRRQ